MVGPGRADGAPASDEPVRIGWARDLIARHFRLETQVGAPLAGIDLLDVGCGAGLFAEPLARLGADVVGLDPAPAAIEAARAHAEETGARLAYRVGTVEELAAEPRRFDVVSAMEVVEHAADPKASSPPPLRSSSPAAFCSPRPSTAR